MDMTHPRNSHEPNCRCGGGGGEVREEEGPDELDGIETERVDIALIVPVPFERATDGEDACDAVDVEECARGGGEERDGPEGVRGQPAEDLHDACLIARRYASGCRSVVWTQLERMKVMVGGKNEEGDEGRKKGEKKVTETDGRIVVV